MGLFSRFRNKQEISNVFRMVTEKNNSFYSWNGKIYQSDIIRACIRPKSKGIGKLIPKHIQKDNINNVPYIKYLLQYPNPMMTMQMMLEKMTTQLELNGNAFAIIIRSSDGLPFSIYPITCYGVETVYDSMGYLSLKFSLADGTTKVVPYVDVIHLRQDYNEDELFGTSPMLALSSLMEIVNTTDNGMVSAVKNGAIVRWLLKFKGVIKPEDMSKQTEDFSDSYLNINNNKGGAMATDGKFDVEQIKPESYVPNAAQLDRPTKRIYNFFNTNEKIVSSSYNEDEWNSYYESEIEPLSMQLSNEFTRKLFTRRQLELDARIEFTATNLQYASMQSKLGLQAMVDRGAMTANEWRKVMNLPTVENGDGLVIRREYTTAGGDLDNEN